MENNIEKILVEHKNDVQQLKVITSQNKNIMIEAPAGYGKTKTLISKIQAILLQNELPKYKRILCLTFSVNAAYKIKKDVFENFLDSEFRPEQHLVIGNFHSVARIILKKYGYLIFGPNYTIHDFKVISSEEISKSLNEERAKIIEELSNCVSEGFLPEDFNQNLLLNYNSIIKKKAIKEQLITYDSILTFAIELLVMNEEIKKFYNNYFNVVIIDEFQDTNILSWSLTKQIITEQTKKIFLGDSLQRIYGFIGAIPNLIDIVTEEYNMEYIQLQTNYRFSNNPVLLQLEKNIRENARLPQNPMITKNAKISFSYLDNQVKEAEKVLEIVQNLMENDPDAKIAILVKQRGNNIQAIKKKIEDHEISVFDGLFTDDSPEYVSFHSTCLNYFYDKYKQNITFTKKDIKPFCDEIASLDLNGNSESFVILLRAALQSITLERNYFIRNEIIIDLLVNNGLKNYLNKIESRVIVTTVHASKGLEWEYVILPDMEQGLFPNYYGLCQKNQCQYKNTCKVTIDEKNEYNFVEEISVFYVAITRAKKDIYFTASKLQIGRYRSQVVNISCLLDLPGIEYNL